MAKTKTTTKKTARKKGKVKSSVKARATAKKSSAKPRKKTTPKVKKAAVSKVTGKKVVRATAKKKTTSRTSTTSQHEAATSQDPIQFPELNRKTPKTYLTAKELREFQAILLHKRQELCSDVAGLTDQALNTSGGSRGVQSSMPIHMADLGSDNWEKEFTLGLIANEQARVREIDAALERIDQKIYGVCLATHAKIEIARLRAKPWAKYCIEYARAREEGRVS